MMAATAMPTGNTSGTRIVERNAANPTTPITLKAQTTHIQAGTLQASTEASTSPKATQNRCAITSSVDAQRRNRADDRGLRHFITSIVRAVVTSTTPTHPTIGRAQLDANAAPTANNESVSG